MKLAHENMRQKLSAELGSRLDTQWIQEWLPKIKVCYYTLDQIPVALLKATVFDGEKWNNTPIADSPAYLYLAGKEEIYRKNIAVRQKKLDNNIHSVEKYERLLASLEAGCRNDFLIIVNQDMVIVDGMHRAAWWGYTYGMDALIPVVKIFL